MNRLKKNALMIFSKFTLKQRLLITYLFLSSTILLATSVAFYNASKNILIERAIRSSQQQLSLITSNLGEKIDHIADYGVTLSINSNITDVLKKYPSVPDNELDHFLINTELTNQAQRIIGLHKNIYAWDILDTENHWFHSSSTDTDELNTYLSSDYLKNLKNDLSFRFLGPFPIRGNPVFVGLKPITNIDNTKYLGTVALLIKETNISSAFRNLPDGNFKNFFILDKNKKILSSSSSKGIYENFNTYTKISLHDLDLLEKNGAQIVSVNGTQTLMIQKEYQELDWQVINLIPVESLTIEHTIILNNIILISIFLLLLSLIFSILCTKTVTAPIQRLASKMETASHGNLSITASYDSHDELSILYEQFNLMMQRIQSLLTNVYNEQNAKQKMEIRLLQSQINPHFLYNTLNTIKSLIELEMFETAIKAVTAMSSFYRNSLSKGKFIISLRQELLLTEQYLYIQNLRYMEFVDYEILYDAESPDMEIEIPKLTIQPIVENIFVHALGQQKCHICVKVQSEETALCIKISDNGVGISHEKLLQLQASISTHTETPSSFGLPSIHHRISLLYGKNYGLSIKSEYTSGTTVTIYLPKGETKNEDIGNY